MKYIILILLFSCTTPTPQTTAEKNIKTWLKTNLDDPSSYEPGNFGKIDSFFIPLIKSKEWKDYEKWSYSDDARVVGTDSMHRRLNLLKDNYIGEFDGYQLEHQYRAKNKMGALIKVTDNFHLNLNYLVIDKTKAY